jgi:hypothetical protein
MATAERFEDLGVWQDARQLVRQIYTVSKLRSFRRDFSLRDQITRAATSRTRRTCNLQLSTCNSLA